MMTNCQSDSTSARDAGAPAIVKDLHDTRVIDAILQRFAVDSVIVSDLAYLEGASKIENANFIGGTRRERKGRAAGGMMHANDPGLVSRSGKTTTVIVVGQEFGLEVPENKPGAICLGSAPSSSETGLHIKAEDQQYKQIVQFVFLFFF